MKREEAEQYLYCAMSIGEQLLISGAEVSRVEDTIRRICTAYGAKRVDVFSITSCIITTIYGEDFDFCTQTRRISATSHDLSKLDALNALSRRICLEKPDPALIKEKIEEIQNGPRYSFKTQLLIYALVSASFSMFFGGNARDMIASAIIGVLLKFLELFIKRGSVNNFITALICSTAGGFLSNLSVMIGLGQHADLINIGNIMLLIPGIAFTNSIRDLFSGDIISGLTRFIESITLAMVIALGFTLGNFIL